MDNKIILGSIDLTLMDKVERDTIVRNLVYHYDEQFKQHGQYIIKIDFSMGYRNSRDRDPIPYLAYGAYYCDNRSIGGEYLSLEHRRKSFLGAELLKRVLTEENPAFKKDCDLEFKDAMNLIYLNALVRENVLTKEHVTAYFKEFAQIVIKEKEYSNYLLGYGVPFENDKKPLSKTYTTDGTKPSVDSGMIFFLESRRLLKKKSLTPGVNSANAEPLSCEEEDVLDWFKDFLKNQGSYEKRLKFDILKNLGIAHNTISAKTLFSEIFEEEDLGNLEVKF